MEVHYYWHDYSMFRGKPIEIEEIEISSQLIQESINNHDWDKFKLYKFILEKLCNFTDPNGKKLKFFPNTVIYITDIGYIEKKLTKKTFMEITFSEYENG